MPINISALVESVVQLSQISALSSIPMSPNRVREDYTYDTVKVFRVCQVSPDDTQYLPATTPVTPPDSEILPTSLIPPDPDCLLPGGTGSFDSILTCQSLIEQATDLSRLSIQVLGQYATSLNHMSSEVMRLAFDPEIFPAEVIDTIAPVLRVHRATTHM